MWSVRDGSQIDKEREDHWSVDKTLIVLGHISLKFCYRQEVWRWAYSWRERYDHHLYAEV